MTEIRQQTRAGSLWWLHLSNSSCSTTVPSGTDIEQWSHPSPALGRTRILTVHGRPGLPPALVPRCRREVIADDPIGTGGQPGVPSPGRCSIPTQLHPAPAWCMGAGALPAHPCGAEVLVHRAGLGEAILTGQAARGGGTGHKDRVKTKDLCRKQDGGCQQPCPDGQVLSAPKTWCCSRGRGTARGCWHFGRSSGRAEPDPAHPQPRARGEAGMLWTAQPSPSAFSHPHCSGTPWMPMGWGSPSAPDAGALQRAQDLAPRTSLHLTQMRKLRQHQP